jgi:hypothetical protein
MPMKGLGEYRGSLSAKLRQTEADFAGFVHNPLVLFLDSNG